MQLTKEAEEKSPQMEGRIKYVEQSLEKEAVEFKDRVAECASLKAKLEEVQNES